MSVTYVSEGDAATPANLNTWFNDVAAQFYNVKRYGAVGDGTTDDASSIQDAITAAEAVNGMVMLLPGLTYLCGTALTIHKAQMWCPGQATLKFTGIGSSTDLVTIQGSRPDTPAGLEGINIDCNNTGRHGLTFAGGKTGENASDFAFYRRGKVTGSVKDGIHFEPHAANAWIENARLDDVRIDDAGRHCIAFVQPDLATTFINKGSYFNVEVRGAGQHETGYEVYVEGQGTNAARKISEHSWVNLEADAQGAANHGAHAIYFTETGSVSFFDGWTFIQPTLEDTGSVAGLAEAIGINGTGVDIRGLVVLGCVFGDFTKIVDETLLDNNALIIGSNAGRSWLQLTDTSENYLRMDDTLSWGAAAGSVDTNLYREAADRLYSDDTIGAGAGFRQARTVVTSSSGAITLGYGTNYVTLSENVTSITFPTAFDGVEIEVVFKQAAGANYTVSGWPATVRLAGGAFTATATNDKADVLCFRYNAGIPDWLETSRSQNL